MIPILAQSIENNAIATHFKIVFSLPHLNTNHTARVSFRNKSMKKILTSTVICILCFLGADAQLQFKRVGATAPDLTNTHDFRGVSNGMCLAADLNGDGLDDVVTAGEGSSFFSVDTKIFLNDGFNNFPLKQGTLPAIERAHMTSGDVDGDGDVDLYISGWKSGEWIHGLYLNDGDANFTSLAIPNVVATDRGFSKLIDLDGDTDLDLFITGRNSSLMPLTEIFLNDGFGGFTPMPSSLEAIQQSTAAFGDIDNDSDIDIVIAGYNTAFVLVCQTYIKTPTGYTLLPNAALPGFSTGTLDLGDFDQDGDLDLLFTGQVQGANYSSGLFKNNGSGTFTAFSTDMIGVYLGSGYFADIDNDADLDIIINGNTSAGVFQTEVYINTNGTYANSGVDIIGSDQSKLLIVDLNNDDYVDILVTGRRNGIGSTKIADLYINDGNGGFNLLKNTPFDSFGEFASHGDVDGDGDLDVVICGIDMYDQVSYTRIYLNDGLGNYTVDNNNQLIPMRGEIHLVDFDADGDLDITICGNSVVSYATPTFNMVIYKNDGTGSFSLWATLPGVVLSADWADVDGDGDLDYIITGQNSSGQATTALYIQNASNNFTLSPQPFDPLLYSAVHFFDCDNDEDMDVMLAGNGDGCITKLFTNDGSGNFTLDTGSSFTPLSSTPQIGSTDANNDGFLDLVIFGEQCNLGFNCDIYFNNGSGQFTLNQNLSGNAGTKLELIDMNNDGLDDILFSGFAGGANTQGLVYYYNDGSGNFVVGSTNIEEGAFGFFTIFDADGDNDNDIVIPGYYRVVSAGLFKNVTGEVICSPVVSTDIVSSCSAYVWIDGNTYTESNNTATFNIIGGAANGCDSLVTLHLTIGDEIAPLPDLPALPDFVSECIVTSLIEPTATDNCAGLILGTHDASFPITESTTVMWTFDDGNGNTTTQVQNVLIEDVTPPVSNQETLADVESECSIDELTAPFATDNCAGLLVGVANIEFPITESTIVTWTFDDGNGNTTTQLQNVLIEDVTPPVSNQETLADAVSECPINQLAVPLATDNCAGLIEGVPNITFPITETTIVTYTFDDGNGNTSTITRNVIITPIDNTVTPVDPITLSANASGYNYQWVDCDNGNAPISGANSQTFVATANGNYAVIIDNNICSVVSACNQITGVGIETFTM
ncbi:MAG: hypothetical protein RL226_19, partial [Bacteroidota bacterium]